MKPGILRSIFRWVHIVLSIPIIGYIYGKPADVAQYADGVRYLFFPIMVLTGLLMWKGDFLRRLFSKQTA